MEKRMIKNQEVSLLGMGCMRLPLREGTNEIDFERTSRSILDDFRKGRLGKIILDKADV